jgi:hypothetical protein
MACPPEARDIFAIEGRGRRRSMDLAKNSTHPHGRYLPTWWRQDQFKRFATMTSPPICPALSSGLPYVLHHKRFCAPRSVNETSDPCIFASINGDGVFLSPSPPLHHRQYLSPYTGKSDPSHGLSPRRTASSASASALSESRMHPFVRPALFTTLLAIGSSILSRLHCTSEGQAERTLDARPAFAVPAPPGLNDVTF